MQQFFFQKLAYLAKEIALTLHVCLQNSFVLEATPALSPQLPKTRQVWLTKPGSVYCIMCMFAWKQKSCLIGTISHHLSIMGNFVYNRPLDSTNFSYWTYVPRSMPDLKCLRLYAWKSIAKADVDLLKPYATRQVCILRLEVKSRTSQMTVFVNKRYENKPTDKLNCDCSHIKVSQLSWYFHGRSPVPEL